MNCVSEKFFLSTEWCLSSFFVAFLISFCPELIFDREFNWSLGLDLNKPKIKACSVTEVLAYCKLTTWVVDSLWNRVSTQSDQYKRCHRIDIYLEHIMYSQCKASFVVICLFFASDVNLALVRGCLNAGCQFTWEKSWVRTAKKDSQVKPACFYFVIKNYFNPN